MPRKVIAMVVAMVTIVALLPTPFTDRAAALNPDLVTIDGQFGDGLTGGGSYSKGPGDFSVLGTRQGVSIQVTDPLGMWGISMVPAQGGTLAVGFYEDTARFGGVGTPQLDMTFHSSGCNESNGRFVIDEIAFDGSNVITALVAHWEQHCEHVAIATYGSISWNGSTPLSPRDAVGPNNFPNVKMDTVATAKAQTFVNNDAGPVDVTGVTLTGTDADQFTITADGCTGTTLAAGAQCDVTVTFAPTQMGRSLAAVTVVDSAHPSGTALPLRGTAIARVASYWTEGEQGDPLVGATHRAGLVDLVHASVDHASVVVPMLTPTDGFITVSGPGTAPLKTGTYAITQTFPTPTAPALETVMNGVGCNTVSARVVVRQIAFGRDGTVSRFVASWEIHCNGLAAASFGAVNFNGTVPFTQRTISPLTGGYGSLNVGTSTVRTYTLKNNGPGPLHVVSAKVGGANASQFVLVGTKCSNVTLAPGASCTATVRYAPKVAGSHTAKLTFVDAFAPVAGIGNGQDVALTGRGIAGPTAFLEGEYDDSWVGPAHVALSAVQVTGTRNGIFIAGNEGNDTWEVILSPRTGTSFSSVPVTLATKQIGGRDTTHAGLSVVWNNLLCRTATGRLAIDQLAFNANGTVQSITARWEYHCGGEAASSFGGVRANGLTAFSVPDLTDVVTWEQVPLGASGVVKPVVLSNRGPSPLPVGKVALQGPDAAQFAIVSDACSNRTLAAGSACTVTVRFAPVSGLGERRARVAFPHAGALLGKGGTGQDAMLLGSATVPAASNYGELTMVEPARVLDTTNGVGAPKAPLGPKGTLAVQVSGRGGVPATGVSAVMVRITSRRTTAAGSTITAWPAGSARPDTVTIVPQVGRAIAGLATVRLGTGGRIQLYNVSGSSDVTVDVIGWYSDLNGPGGSRYHSLTPTRVVDTRDGRGGVPITPITGGTSLGVDLRSLGGVPATGVTAVAINVTVTSASATGALTVHPGDVARPTVATIPVTASTPATNLVVVRMPTDGVVQFFNSTGNVDVAVDVLGYWTASATGNSGRFIPVPQYRTLDTRVAGGPMVPGDRWYVFIGGEERVAHDAGAVALNVVAMAPTTAGDLRAFSDEQCDKQPDIATVTFTYNRTVANGTFTSLSRKRSCAAGTGMINVFNSAGNTQSLIDVWGYFTP